MFVRQFFTLGLQGILRVALSVASREVSSVILSAALLPATVKAQAVAVAGAAVECVQSVCGDKAKGSWAIPPQQILKAKEAVEKDLKRPISNYIGRAIHQAFVTNQAFQDFLQMHEFPSQQMDTKFLGFIVALQHLQRMSQYKQAVVLNENKQYVIDRDKLKQQNPNLSVSEVEAIMGFTPHLNAFIVEPGYFKYPFPAALKLKFGRQTSIQSAQAQLAQEVRLVEIKIQSVFPFLKDYMGVHPEVNKALTGQTLSEPEQTALTASYLTALKMKVVLADDVLEKFSRLSLDLKAIQNEARTKYENSQLKSEFDKPSIKKLYKDAYGQCMTYLTYSYAALPTRAEIVRFQKFLSSLEKTAQDMLEERKRVSLAASFHVEYLFPTPQEDFVGNMAQVFTAKKIDLDTALQKRIDMQTDTGFQMGLFIITTYNDQKVLQEATSLCAQFIPAPVDDLSFSGVGVLKVGRTSILNPEIGAPVIAHELGHQLHAKFPQDISEELDCLRAVQGTERYLKEDFADLFSAEVMKRLKYHLHAVTLENIGCAVMDLNKKGEFIAGTLNNENQKRVHSSGLYRLIAFSSLTTGVTPQCQKILAEANETRFVNYCRWR